MNFAVLALTLCSASSPMPRTPSLVPALELSTGILGAAAGQRTAGVRLGDTTGGVGSPSPLDADRLEQSSRVFPMAIAGSLVGNLAALAAGGAVGAALLIALPDSAELDGAAIGALTGVALLGVLPPVLATRAARNAAGHHGGRVALPLLAQLAVMVASSVVAGATDEGIAFALAYGVGTFAVMPLVAARTVEGG